MSVRRRRCLSVAAAIAWLAWLATLVLILVLMEDISRPHVIAMTGALAVPIVLTISLIVVSSVAPVLAVLRALVAADSRECPKCAARRQSGIRVAPILNRVRSDG